MWGATKLAVLCVNGERVRPYGTLSPTNQFGNLNTFESCVAFYLLFYLRNDGLCLRVGEDFWPLNCLIGVAVVMGVLVVVLMMLIRKMT